MSVAAQAQSLDAMLKQPEAVRCCEYLYRESQRYEDLVIGARVVILRDLEVEEADPVYAVQLEVDRSAYLFDLAECETLVSKMAPISARATGPLHPYERVEAGYTTSRGFSIVVQGAPVGDPRHPDEMKPLWEAWLGIPGHGRCAVPVSALAGMAEQLARAVRQIDALKTSPEAPPAAEEKEAYALLACSGTLPREPG
jgi:hypothetical protein